VRHRAGAGIVGREHSQSFIFYGFELTSDVIKVLYFPCFEKWSLINQDLLLLSYFIK